MKRLGILFMTIISVILLIIFGSKVFAYPYDGELKFGSISGWYSSAKPGVYYFQLTDVTPEKCNNLYCLKKGYKLPTGSMASKWNYTYWCIAKAKMEGDSVTFWKVDKYRETSGKTTRARNEDDYLLAAILCSDPDEYGMWSSGANYTESQKALYEHWDDWVGAGGTHFKTTGTDGGSGAWKYESAAKETAYDMTIYQFWTVDNKGIQPLLLVERRGSSTRQPPTIDIGVTKVWNDGNNAHGNRPGSITVKLKRNDSQVASKTLSGSGNEWYGTFYDQDDTGGYSVSEPSITGYTSKVSGFTITNTPIKTSVKVTKQWDDEENRDGKRPRFG